MSKHLDWSRISPDIAIWCRTEEEDLAFHQACEEHGILWMAGDRPNPDGKYCMSGHCAMRDCRTDSAIIPYSDLLVEDKPAKSRLAEILGVEEDEEWEYGCGTYRIHGGRRQIFSNKSYWQDTVDESVLNEIIANRDSIIRKPRFSQDELAVMSALHAGGAESVYRSESGALCWKDGNGYSSFLPPSMFPSIRPGESVELADILAPAPC